VVSWHGPVDTGEIPIRQTNNLKYVRIRSMRESLHGGLTRSAGRKKRGKKVPRWLISCYVSCENQIGIRVKEGTKPTDRKGWTAPEGGGASFAAGGAVPGGGPLNRGRHGVPVFEMAY